MIVILHIPLFTKWLKTVRDAGARVLMVIDAPEMLETLMSPPDLKSATIHAGERLGKAKEMHVFSDAGTDLRVSLGEYPVMIQYGFSEAPGRYGAGASCTPSRIRAPPTARWSSNLATS
jgi:2,5-dihydroxypyridine 5,6-dioxygenase